MIAPNYHRAYSMALLASAAYLTDYNALSLAVAQQGLEYVITIDDDPGFQATIAMDALNKRNIVMLRGTPVTCSRDINDAIQALLIDAGLDHVSYPGGGKILSGLYRALTRNWPKIQAHLNISWPIVFVGHSLGAAFALAAPSMLAEVFDIEVWAFAPFQFADQAFHRAVYANPRRQRFVFGAEFDFAPGHSRVDPITVMCGPIWHLPRDGTVREETSWPIYRESVVDHSDLNYVALLGHQARIALALAA